jgi:hypothetical protein
MKHCLKETPCKVASALQATDLGWLEGVHLGWQHVQERQSCASAALRSATAVGSKCEVEKAAKLAAGLDLESEIKSARAAVAARHSQLESQMTEASQNGNLQEFQAALKVNLQVFIFNGCFVTCRLT